MSLQAKSDGSDTALARLLDASGRVSRQELQRALGQVRAGGVDLASLLVQRGLIDREELEEVWLPQVRTDAPPPEWATLALGAPERSMDETLREPEPAAAASTGPVGQQTDKRLGPYTVLEELGRGGMGIVLKAWDPRLKRHVAIKKILGQPSVDELLRFKREAEVTARLRHPGIATVFEVVTEGEGAPYLVMEYVPGASLKALCNQGELTGRRTAELLRGVADAMAFAHGEGVIHRDLKPHNVVVTPEGKTVVLDFGLARRVRDESVALTLTGDLLGTPAYMAPEQVAADQETGPHTDVYGLGAILYECLAGRAPFGGDAVLMVLAAVQLDEPTPPREVRSNVHRDLETICLKCLEKKPAQRYGSAAELRDELDRFIDGEPIAAAPIGRARRWLRRVRRRKVLAVGAFGLVALIALGVTAVGLGQRAAQAEQERRDLEESQENIRVGVSRSTRGDHVGAVAALTTAILLQPKSAEAHYYRGIGKRDLGDLAGALADFEAGLRLDETLTAAIHARARILIELDIDAAVSAIDEGLRINPEDMNLLLLRAQVRAGLGDVNGALSDLGTVLERRPSLATEVLIRRSRLLMGERRYSEAAEDFTLLLSTVKSTTRRSLIHFNRGECRRVMGDSRRAIEDFSAAIDLNARGHKPYRSRGALLEIQGDGRGAARDYEESLRHSPDQDKADELRKRIQQYLGRPSKY